jgi:hypothetical protein
MKKRPSYSQFWLNLVVNECQFGYINQKKKKKNRDFIGLIHLAPFGTTPWK